MSAKGRPRADGTEAEKPEKDNYPTPPWAVRAIIAGLWPEISDPRQRDDPMKPLVICDPCCGEGAFLVEIDRLTRDWPTERRPILLGIDIRPEAVAAARAALSAGAVVLEGDFLAAPLPFDAAPDAFLTNPPYGPKNSDLAARFVRRQIELVRPRGHVVDLLRLNWLSDGEEHFGRATWLDDGNMPDSHVLDQRPSFVGGGTDSCGYAAMHWIRDRRQSKGAQEILRCRDPFVIPTLQALGFSTEHIVPRKRGRAGRAADAPRPRSRRVASPQQDAASALPS